MLLMYPETKCHRAIVHLSIHELRNHGSKHTADYTRERITSSHSTQSRVAEIVIVIIVIFSGLTSRIIIFLTTIYIYDCKMAALKTSLPCISVSGA